MLREIRRFESEVEVQEKQVSVMYTETKKSSHTMTVGAGETVKKMSDLERKLHAKVSEIK